MVIIDSVPQSPSTPSLQLVTLIATHTRITINIPNMGYGRVSSLNDRTAILKVLPLYYIYVTAVAMASAKSMAPLRYSLQGFSDASSIKPDSMVSAIIIRYRVFSRLNTLNIKSENTSARTNRIPAPLALPLLSSPSIAKALPWSWGRRFYIYIIKSMVAIKANATPSIKKMLLSASKNNIISSSV